jgi:hypothetical protein
MLLAKLSKQLRRKRSCFRPKKKRQPSAIASAGAVRSQGLLCRHGSDFGASGADDLVGGAEDFLGALFGYHFRVRTASTAEPILHVTPAILGSLKAQRFATQQGHRFGFYFAEVSRRGFSVSEIYLSAMAQYYVTKFVEKSLKRQLSKRVNRYLTLLCKTLNISVRVIEWNALDTQRGKRSICVPLRDRNWLKFLSVSLA